MKKIISLTAVAALLALPVLVLFPGCSSTTSGIEGSSTMMMDADGGYQFSEYVVVNNPKVARGLQIVNLSQEFVGDILRAQITLASKYSKTQQYQYRFAWLNESGVELDAGSHSWIPFIMYGNETKTLQGVAPNPSARQFKINIRTR